MPSGAGDDLFLNGVGRAQTVYQQASTGEKHVLFHPTSPAPSVNSEERRSWSQASSSFANAQHGSSNHKITHNNTDNLKMKKTEETTDVTEASSSREPHNIGVFDVRNNFKIGIYGWRKRCLYILVLTLLIMVIVNLALTLWVLKVMEFSSEGMGQLKIVSGGIRLEGKAFVLDSLIASSIRSKTGQPIIIESSRNITLTTRDANGLLENLIYLGNDRFECLANNFKIVDDKGNVLFSANDNEITVGAHVLRVTGIGGAMFKGSVQTPLVRTDSSHGLRLESPTSSLEVRGPSGIVLESRAGAIKTLSLNDIQLKSEAGEIKLESSSILMPTLPTAIPSTRVSQTRSHDIFQLCVCNNGKLFMTPPHSTCAAEESSVSTPCR